MAGQENWPEGTSWPEQLRSPAAAAAARAWPQRQVRWCSIAALLVCLASAAAQAVLGSCPKNCLLPKRTPLTLLVPRRCCNAVC